MNDLGGSTFHRLLRFANRSPSLRNDGFGFGYVASGSQWIAFDAHCALILALSDSSIVEADNHAREVVSRETRQSVVDELLGRILRVWDLADKVDGFLVGANVPELVLSAMKLVFRVFHLHHRKPGSETHPGLLELQSP